jgi:LuxR family maltose regulon positive regulatory protein
MNLFDQVTRTKILPPRRRDDLLSRQRLLNLLYDLLDYKLIIVAAPAGYGKTSLLVDMAHHAELPVCWYALDALDRDPQRFIAHLIASITHRFPRFGQRSWAALQSGTGNSLDMDQLVTVIVNEAYENIQEHFVLVLDDYHLVDDSEEIDYFISRFVQEVDENCHLIVASRTLLTLPDLSLMVARSQVSGLSFDELAFQTGEIQALVLQNYHVTMPESVAEEMVRETEGWITGLLLSAQSMWQGMADRLRVARVSGVGLYDYLAQQVLDQQPPHIRNFLLRTSLLEEFDAELCEAILGKGEDWQGLIETVLQNNLFVLPVGDDGTWLRYHHLFRDFLQTRLAEEHPDEEARILRRLAAVYTERKEWEKAHNLYQRLGDVAATANLIQQIGSSLVKGGRLRTLAEWLDALPPETLDSRPALLCLRGIAAVMLGEVERGLSTLSQAEAASRAADDRPRLARALVWRTVAHRFLGNYQASLADAKEALALTDGDESLRAIQAEALKAIGLSLSRMGQLNEAIEWLLQSLTAYDALDEAQNVAMVLMELGTTHMSDGRYDQASAHYGRALDYWRKTDNVTQQAALLNNLGVLHHLRGEYERADSLLEEALICAEQSGHARAEAAALASIGDLYADLDAPEATLDAYRQAREIARRIEDRFLLLYLNLAEAALARSRGDLGRARDLLESGRRLAQQSGSDFEQGLYQLEAGRLALAEGDPQEAISYLEGTSQRFDDGGQQVEGARAHLYLALAYHAVEDETGVIDHLECALRTASELESQHPLVAAGREARRLLENTQPIGLLGRSDPAIARQASRLFNQVTEFEENIPTLRRRLRRGASAVPFAPPTLSIQALGRAQVMVDGKPVASADWQVRWARDLLFCLLAHPDGLTKEGVGAIFWPDSSPKQLKLKFKNTIYRLRHALGQEVVIFDADRYQVNRGLDYEYDVEAFLEKLAQARAATDLSERAAAYRAAVHLYKGPYLPEIEGEWAWWERERLGQAYLEAVLKLTELHLEGGEYEVALDYCQRALTKDPCLEEAHRLAMRIHAAMGNRAAVVRQFEICQQALLKEVNASPSPQTEALYETLMR